MQKKERLPEAKRTTSPKRDLEDHVGYFLTEGTTVIKESALDQQQSPRKNTINKKGANPF